MDTKNLVKEYQDEAMSGDYNNLLRVTMNYVEVICSCLIGEMVEVTARSNDIFHDFIGTVIDMDDTAGFISVQDQDDDVFDVEMDQISYY